MDQTTIDKFETLTKAMGLILSDIETELRSAVQNSRDDAPALERLIEAKDQAYNARSEVQRLNAILFTAADGYESDLMPE